jgi:hypothetical protein
MADQRQQRAARDFLTVPVNRRDTKAAMASRPRESDVLVARDGLRALAAGARVGWKPGQTAPRPQATKVWVI